MSQATESPQQLDKTFRDYAMQYFTLHADQRLKMFQFYITLATAIMGGSFLLLRYGNPTKWIACVWFFAAFLSFIFWKLDGRSRMLIHNAEAALKFLDAQYQLPDIDGHPHPLMIFTRDDEIMNKAPDFPIRDATFTYTRSFKYVFVAASIVGILAGIYALYHFN